MRKESLDNIINQIDEFRKYFVKVRSRFPYMNESAIGLSSFIPPGYYQDEGINVKILLDQPIDEYLRNENNTVAHFINQNFIIRLYSIMNYFEFIGDNISLVKESPGFEEVDILRRLRNIYAHSLGKYDGQIKDHTKLRQVIQNHFGIDAEDYYDFPLDIHSVIDAIIEGCKKYIRSNY